MCTIPYKMVNLKNQNNSKKRKAWIGDWEPIKGETYWGIFNNIAVGICTNPFAMSNTAMSFPTKEMAEDFLNCFKDLCETAKILL